MPVEGKKNVEKEKREGIALEDDWRSRVQIFYFVWWRSIKKLYSIFNAIAVIRMRKETIDSLIWVTYKDSKIVLSNRK